MLAPKAISVGLAFNKSANAAAPPPTPQSVSALVGYAQWVLALWW
jgi:hypothetical protein